ncbi:FYVE-domain-containing protein [Periconia macrospinosa]|uniref:FYVE-domain-containing protein n=1 Tax=Periconia macrospinosa TaxID=97972 RepID=A0A2V1DCI1_9PLEO|nr:FYVE-domain-containing protein [Periconia macrospinosa]
MNSRAESGFARTQGASGASSPSPSPSPSLPPSHDDRDTRGEQSGDAGEMDVDIDIASGMGMEMDMDVEMDGGGRAVNNLDGSSEDARVGHRFGKRRAEQREGSHGWNGSGNASGSGNGDVGPSTGISTSHVNAARSVNTEQMNKAFGGQTWIDFLRESGDDDGGASNDLRAPPHTTRRPPPAATTSRTNSSEHPLPPLPVDDSPPPLSTHQRHQILHQDRSAARRIRSYSGAPAPSSNDRGVLPPLPAQWTHSHSEQLTGAPTPPDRKRRLTTADNPVRRGSGVHSVDLGTRGPPPPPPSSHLPPSHSGSGASSADPIVLDAAPVPSPRRRRSDMRSVTTPAPTGTGPRRESDLVLPPWQPDADVTHCFVCGSQFTFFYRKHHCRKCGRVVCSACSPHRITIPRQFIVHPPSEAPNVIDLTGDGDENTMSAFGPFRNPALGGGEEVRVCNPCVPDPNYNPPPPYSPPSNHRTHSGGHWSAQSLQGHGNPPTMPSRNPSADVGRRPPGAADLLQTFQPHPQSSHTLYPPYLPHYDPRNRAHSRNTSTPQTPRIHPSHDRFFSNPYINQQGSSTHSYHINPHQSQTSHHHAFQPPPPPRREIPEEDECPICGNELPPKGPDNDEAARIQHVEDCIRLHSSSPPPASTSQQHTSTSLPSQRTRGMSNAATLLNANAANNAGNSGTNNGEGASATSNLNSNRMSMSARGMYVYTATEKDCVDDEGAEAECVICFEEFEAGVRMARLVCFCKFHEKCIKQWWDTKGRGACPTHQLHD